MIKLANLQFAYPNSNFVLKIASLEIQSGEKIAFVGPSGCGKTTLLNLLAGILLPDSGTIELHQTAVSSLSDAARRNFRISNIGQVFQRFELVEYLQVLDNILLPYLINKSLHLNDEVIAKAKHIANQMGLADKLQRWPSRLSQGEQQRVAIGRAILVNPSWILADEPTGSLDPTNKLKIIELLFQQTEQNNSTLLVVTHDTAILKGFDRVIDFDTFRLENPAGSGRSNEASEGTI